MWASNYPMSDSEIGDYVNVVVETDEVVAQCSTIQPLFNAISVRFGAKILERGGSSGFDKKRFGSYHHFIPSNHHEQVYIDLFMLDHRRALMKYTLIYTNHNRIYLVMLRSILSILEYSRFICQNCGIPLDPLDSLVQVQDLVDESILKAELGSRQADLWAVKRDLMLFTKASTNAERRNFLSFLAMGRCRFIDVDDHTIRSIRFGVDLQKSYPCIYFSQVLHLQWWAVNFPKS